MRTPTGSPLVVLAGLEPGLERALQSGLQAEGLDFRVQPDPASSPLHAPGPVVYVLPLAGGASQPLPHGSRADSTAVVVVAEAAVGAYLVGLASGATSAITPTTPVEDAIAVIRGAARGQVVLPVAVVQALQRAAGPAIHLSAVERGWLRELSEGSRVTDLARAAGLTDRDMYQALSVTYARLGGSTRAEALLIAERAGLLDGPD